MRVCALRAPAPPVAARARRRGAGAAARTPAWMVCGEDPVRQDRDLRPSGNPASCAQYLYLTECVVVYSNVFGNYLQNVVASIEKGCVQGNPCVTHCAQASTYNFPLWRTFSCIMGHFSRTSVPVYRCDTATRGGRAPWRVSYQLERLVHVRPSWYARRATRARVRRVRPAARARRPVKGNALCGETAPPTDA